LAKENVEKKQPRKQKRSNRLRPELQSEFAPFLQVIERSSRAVLFVDYDGTLAPFRTERDHAYPYPGVASLLQEIIRNGRTRVVVVSGREATEVLPLLNIRPEPEVWGVHGLQRLRADGGVDMPLLDERTMDGLSDADGWLSYQRLRHVAEVKTGSIAAHWRGLDELATEDIRARVLLGWRPIAEHSELDLLQFDGGVEIRARQADKGAAVRKLLREFETGTPTAYLGDDATDESAFLVINNLAKNDRTSKTRAITVLVRPERRPTAAQFWLKPPEELLDFLNQWLRACSEKQLCNSGAAAAMKL
jgi:trehalose 6-phosphate phosphatase